MERRNREDFVGSGGLTYRKPMEVRWDGNPPSVLTRLLRGGSELPQDPCWIKVFCGFDIENQFAHVPAQYTYERSLAMKGRP